MLSHPALFVGILAVVIVVLFEAFSKSQSDTAHFKFNHAGAPSAMLHSEREIPIVLTTGDATRFAGQKVYVEGIYEQNDVRMAQVNPPRLFTGHVVLILNDGGRVFINPPSQSTAIRTSDEIAIFEHRAVRVLGQILPRIPQEGTVEIAPCLVEIESIVLADNSAHR